MQENLLILKKIILALVGGGAAFLALYMALFTFVWFLVPTSSPNQVQEWTNTVVTVLGVKMNQLSLERLKAVVIGSSVILPLATIAWFSIKALLQQRS